MEKYSAFYNVLCIVWYLIFICAILYLKFKCSMPYVSKFKEKIYSKVPSKLKPSELSNLMYKKVSADVFTSTIMFLVNKDVLTLKKTKEDFVIFLNSSDADLTHSEKMIVDILINNIGNGIQVTFQEIEDYSKSKYNCSEFLLNYQMWMKMAVKESNQKKFYEDKNEYSLVKNIRLFGIILFIINILLSFHSLIGYFILVPSCFIVLYFYKIYKRTIEANEEYNKWLAFKYYLQHIEDYEYKKEDIADYIICGLVLKIPDLERKLTSFHCVERLNQLINRNVKIAILKGDRSIKF